jgi:hypothetical protein
MAKIYLIDAERREIRESEWSGDSDTLRRHVGGYLDTVRNWPTREACYCDDEGIFKLQQGFFAIEGQPQPIAGNGVVVGAERLDVRGALVGYADPSFSLEELRRSVQFMTRQEVQAWARRHANVPAVQVTTTKPGEPPQTTVHQTYGSLMGNLPHPPQEQSE